MGVSDRNVLDDGLRMLSGNGGTGLSLGSPLNMYALLKSALERWIEGYVFGSVPCRRSVETTEKIVEGLSWRSFDLCLVSMGAFEPLELDGTSRMVGALP